MLLTGTALGFWHAAKPLPPGVRVASVFRRVAESDIEFVANRQETLTRQLAIVDRAEQLIVLDQSPVPRELAQAVLVRKHVKPKLKVVVLTDPANSIYDGAAAQDLPALERAGIVVVRINLDRLRDSNPVYSGLWRLAFGWWSDPFTEQPGEASLRAAARHLNFKSDERQLMVADDGSGAWASVLGSAYADPGLILRGALAGDIVASEFKLASWSAEDDRLPAAPTAPDRRVGTIDARFLSESAIGASLLEAIRATAAGDQIAVAVHHLGERHCIDALLRAAARGVEIQLLLDVDPQPNQAVAGEFVRKGGGHVQLRWRTRRQSAYTQIILVHHRADLSMFVTSANLTRRALADFNLESCIELRLGGHAGLARSAAQYFAAAWSSASKYPVFVDESSATYWSYRFKEASGLASF